MHLPPRPPGPRRAALVLALLVLGSLFVLPWNLTAVASWQGFLAALDRVAHYLGAFTAPDLSGPMLARCAGLAVETLAVAVLGTWLGLALAYPLALGSSRCVLLGDDPRRGPGAAARRFLLEGCRLLLDVLRGVPDFVWAVLLANFTGVNATTGVLAIAISVGGILGKVQSEQWDNVDPARYLALRSTGAGRLLVFAYGVQPLAARAMQSFVLMRFECAVRNASVIGVVGGGGLGAALWDEYTDGNWSRVGTVLLCLVLLTTVTDLAANLVRRQLRVDPNHPRHGAAPGRAAVAWRRAVVAGALGAVLAAALVVLRAPLGRALDELQRIEGPFARDYTLGLALPDLSPDTLWAVLRHSLVPLAIGLCATLLGALGAAVLSYPASIGFQIEAHRFTGERLTPLGRAGRWLVVVVSRGVALLLRGVPEVAWVVLLSVFFQVGVTPCVLAVAVHSTGVLHRVFTETVDNVPYGLLERAGAARRAQRFAYAAVPRALADWRTYAFFQFEVNMRIGIALGIVGAGGLGDRFGSNLKFREFGTASSFLWAMVLLTVLVDRLSRWLQLRRNRC